MECWNGEILESQKVRIAWLAPSLLTHHSIFPLFQMAKVAKLSIGGERR